MKHNLGVRCRDQAGMTLIELLVAMMVFALISLAVAYSMAAALQAMGNSKGRVVAANLAAQEIDLVRSIDNVFNLQDKTRVETVAGTPFTITRDTGWVNSSGGDDSCGSGSGSLQHKRVNVTVKWPGAGSQKVRSDTVVAPSSKINDPEFGSIVVRVTNSAGTGVKGVAVTVSVASPADGAVKPTDPILPTDSEGCAYVLKVTEGNYRVAIEKSSYIDVNQSAKPVTPTPIRVAQAAATAVPFTYDLASTVSISYATNYSGTVGFPSNLTMSFESTFGVALVPRASTVELFPFGSGYSVYSGAISAVAGGAPACGSRDPARWPTGGGEAPPVGPEAPPAGPEAPPGVVIAAPTVETAPGEATSVSVPMGVVRIPNTSGSDWTVSAIQVFPTPGSADPGCLLDPETLALGTIKKGAAAVMALPYGTWKIVRSSGTSVTEVTVLTGGSVAGDTVTLDPRAQ